MTKKSGDRPKERMIHIRLDEETHRHIKIEAVKNDTTIQQLIEDLILRNLIKPQSEGLK